MMECVAGEITARTKTVRYLRKTFQAVGTSKTLSQTKPNQEESLKVTSSIRKLELLSSSFDLMTISCTALSQT